MAAFCSLDKPDLHYPCQWQYKVIGEDPQKMKEAIAEAVGRNDLDISHSNKSAKGKYCSLKFDILVLDETQRNTIFHHLKTHPAIRYVL